MTIRAIVFDFGKVIGHFDYRRGGARLAPHTDVSIDEMLQLAYHVAIEDEYESGRVSSADFLDKVKEACRLRCPTAEIAAAFADIFWANEEVCALVPRLAPHYRLLLGSNTNEIHADRFKQQFADTLRHFHTLVLSHEVGVRKPRAGFFEHCIRLAEVPAVECLFIDDLADNVAGARACGLQAIHYIGFPDLQQRLEELGVRMD
ncbi:MAG: HAD family hydrolase [Gemmataceae bacterium]